MNRLAALTKTDRTAWILLLVHVMATLFASMAFATILSGPPPEWLQHEPNRTIYEIGWKVSGPSVVCLGFLAALLSGLIAIRFMLGYLRRHGLGIFVAYRLVLAVIVVVSLGLG